MQSEIGTHANEAQLLRIKHPRNDLKHSEWRLKTLCKFKPVWMYLFENLVNPSRHNRRMTLPFKRWVTHRARHAASGVHIPPACIMLHNTEYGSGGGGERDASYRSTQDHLAVSFPTGRNNIYSEDHPGGNRGSGTVNAIGVIGNQGH